MKIHIGSDHAGFRLKSEIIRHLKANGQEVTDHGTTSEAPTDYPDHAARVARAVRDDTASLGILTCGSGIGVCISANKVAGIRAVSAWNPEVARLSREHNDANIVCLGQRMIDTPAALAIVDAFLAGKFEGGRHIPRVAKIADLEKQEATDKAVASERNRR